MKNITKFLALILMLLPITAFALGGTSGTGTGTSLTANGSGGGGVSSFTGDGTLLSNSASSGAVTATLANAPANTVFGNNTGAGAAGSYQTSINISGTLASGNQTTNGTDIITSNSAAAFAAGPNGNTNPVWRINASGASSQTGFEVAGTATGTMATITALDPGTLAGMNLIAKNNGPILLSTPSGNISALGGNAVILGNTVTALLVQSNNVQINQKLTVLGGLSINTRVIADAAATVGATDYNVAYGSITAARVVSVACASLGTATNPQYFIVKDQSGNAGITNTITITATTGTIDGAATKVINTAYGSFRIYANGTNCFLWQ